MVWLSYQFMHERWCNKANLTVALRPIHGFFTLQTVQNMDEKDEENEGIWNDDCFSLANGR